MQVTWLGTVEYCAAWDLQRELAALRAESEIGDVLLLLEHPPTITLGRGADSGNLLVPRDSLKRKGIAVYDIDRGGDVTYHGPGQLVGYPIVDLNARGRDLHRFLRDQEEALIRALSGFGVAGRRFPPHTGVWVEDRKIAAIGVKVTHWVSTHGFALNVCPDMSHFDLIVPCGIRDYSVTSLQTESGESRTLEDMLEPVGRAFQHVFGTTHEVPGALERLSDSSRDILGRAVAVL